MSALVAASVLPLAFLLGSKQVDNVGIIITQGNLVFFQCMETSLCDGLVLINVEIREGIAHSAQENMSLVPDHGDVKNLYILKGI